MRGGARIPNLKTSQINTTGISSTNGTIGTFSSTAASTNTLSVINALSFSPSSAAAGMILTSDATGNASWKATISDSSRNSVFYAANNVAQSFASDFIPTLPTENYDAGNNFASSIYTIPSSGTYSFLCESFFNFTNTTSLSTLRIHIETPTFTIYGSNAFIVPANYSGFIPLQANAVYKFIAGTQIRIRILVNGAVGTQSLSRISLTGIKIN